MKYLAIDTCGSNLTLALRQGEKLNTYFDENCGVRHSIDLMPRIEELLLKEKVSLKDLDFIAVTVGAGSFTGIRIGVSTAKALCFAHGLPCLAITSFDTIAYNKCEGKNLAVINAGHDGFYVCGYENMEVVLAPQYIMKDKLKELSKEYLLLSFEKIDGIKTKVVSLKDGFIKACDEKYSLKTLDYDSIEPLYVRKSQAEEGR